MSDSNLLTEQEERILEKLKEVWNEYQSLRHPPYSEISNHEFMHGIHALQALVMARPYLREQRNKE